MRPQTGETGRVRVERMMMRRAAAKTDVADMVDIEARLAPFLTAVQYIDLDEEAAALELVEATRPRRVPLRAKSV